MRSLGKGRVSGGSFLVAFLLVSSIGILLSSHFAAASPMSGPATLPSTTFVSAPPAGASQPDDLTLSTTPGLDHGQPVIWTEYQNGIQPNGTARSPGGATQSDVVGYDLSTGAVVQSVKVTGHVDGMTFDTETGGLIATSNEDDFSTFNLINPASGAVTTYQYSPNPAVSGNGGTDSIAIWQGEIFVTHSNPNDTSQATEYLVTLNNSTMTADLAPVFYDNSNATNALTGATVKLALTDPDTNFVTGNELVTVSQGDGVLIFDSNLGPSPQLTLLPLTDNKAGNMPPVDGFTVATSDQGTLYVVDAAKGTITALGTTGWPTGTVFVGEPSDNGNPLVGVLNLSTGVITPFGNTFTNPKDILFVPASTSAVVSASSTITSTTTKTVTTTQTITSTETATTTVTSTSSSSALPASYLIAGVVPIVALIAAVLLLARFRNSPGPKAGTSSTRS